VSHKKGNNQASNLSSDGRLEELRRLAEDIVNRQPREAVQPEVDRVLELLQELEIYQVELRLQNEELMATQENLAKTSDQYQDLFEFAPVGYLTFDPKGKIIEANLTLAKMLGQERQYLQRFGLSPFLDPENLSCLVKHRQQILEAGQARPCELELVHKGRVGLWVHIDSRPIRDELERITGCRSTLTDITVRKRLEEERRKIAEILDLLNKSNSVKIAAWRVTSFLKKWLDIEAVGLRLKEVDDYPYLETQGFPEGFVVAENSLCTTDELGRVLRDQQGNPVLECMCGNVISGRFDPNLPFFTQKGSFWTNSTTKLLAKTTQADRQARTRNRCHGDGYESVALIPLRTRERALGLIQLNDTRPDRFTPEMVAMLERLAEQLSMGLAEQMARFAEMATLVEKNNILSTTSDGFMLLNQEGRFIDVNESVCRGSGYSREEFLDMSLGDFLVEGENEIFEHIKGVAIGEAERFESRFRRKGGTAVDLEITLNRPPELEGKTVIFARDISERKRASKALSDSEALNRTMAENFPEGAVFIFDCQGRYVYANGTELKDLGMAPQDLAGKKIAEVFPSDLAGVAQPMHERVLAGETVRYEVEFKGRIYDNVAVPIQDNHGEVFQGLVIARNVTQHRELEQALRQAQKMEAVGTLAGGIAHDFNNILAMIMGFADLALDELDPDHPARYSLTQITKASERAKQIVLQILTFSRKAKADYISISLNDTVREAVAMLGNTIPKMVGLDVELGLDLRPVKADPHQIEQIIMNLVSNAVDAMSGSGIITLSTENVNIERIGCDICNQVISGEYVMLSVKDSGSGMDLETKGKIFEPFFTTKGVGKGTGLGLSTVYGIVTSHDGHVICQTDPGTGTEFRVYLPVAFELISRTEAPQKTGDQPSENKETILVVDDEASLRELAQRILTRSGYKVLLAQSGEEALVVHEENPGRIDATLLDLGMPGMGGHKCLKKILANNPKAKIVAASGYTTDGQDQKSLGSGAAAFLGKPYRKADLLAMVRSVLDKN
jgi:PAS domain S-box-containing protein